MKNQFSPGSKWKAKSGNFFFVIIGCGQKTGHVEARIECCHPHQHSQECHNGDIVDYTKAHIKRFGVKQ